jgi:DNA-binding transcriptional regulator YiaG
MDAANSFHLELSLGLQQETTQIDERPTAQEVRFARHKNGWTQKNLADLLGVSIASVQAWEQDRRRMPVSSWRLMLLLQHAY